MRLPHTAFSIAALSVTVAASAWAQAVSQPASQSNAAPVPSTRQQLVVLVTVDQLRPDYLERWRSQFTGGLARFMEQGAVFTNAHHAHGATETAPGHATLGAGRHPRSTGIVRNEAGVQDPQTPLVESGRGGGASPFRFRGSSFFDWIRASDPWSQALSVSRKDRGAILPLGRARQSVFWYSTDGRFITSRYYADTLPSWVRDFNARDFVGQLNGASWTLLHPARTYSASDSVARENAGRDFVFPHALPTDRARRAATLTEYPVMDSITVAMTLAGVEALKLGDGTSTDFIGLSLSTTDAVGHRYGPDSRELHDQVLRVDRYLGQFIDSLYRMRDSTRIIFALSADHGVTPYPELFFAGGDSTRGRVDQRPVFASARSALAGFGVEGDALQFESGLVVLDTARLRARGVPVDSVVDALRAQFRALPGVMRVDAVRELEALKERGDPYAERWYYSITPDMDAVLTITLEPYYYWQSYVNASHGMPHELDARVPIIFLGAPFVAGRYERRARTVDVAPTLAKAIGVVPTEPIDGRALQEALGGELSRGTAGASRRANAAPNAAPDAGRNAAPQNVP